MTRAGQEPRQDLVEHPAVQDLPTQLIRNEEHLQDLVHEALSTACEEVIYLTPAYRTGFDLVGIDGWRQLRALRARIFVKVVYTAETFPSEKTSGAVRSRLSLAEARALWHRVDPLRSAARSATCREAPAQAVVIDRTTLFLRGDDGAGWALHAHDPRLAALYRAIAVPSDSGMTADASAQRACTHRECIQGRAVLNAMRDGLGDDAASRRLGISVRTYRRRVAVVLHHLGAETRFQAGFLVAATPAFCLVADAAG